MITATAWVPRGFAAQFPTRAEFNDEEYERIAHLAQIKLDDAEADLEGAATTTTTTNNAEDEEEETSITKTNGDAMDDDNEDEVTEINVLGGSTTTTASTKNSKKKNKMNGIHDKEEVDDDLKEYNLDTYDDSTDEEAEEAQTMGMFGNIKDLAYHENNAADPYITIPDNEDDTEREELQILATDNLLLAGKFEAEGEGGTAHLEIYVYEDEADNLYVHHDFMLPAIPLCVEWLDIPVGSKESPASKDARGNYVAVGTTDPDIEVWNLDTVDSLFPNAILGAGSAQNQPDTSTQKKNKKKKKAAAKKINDTHHIDSVLSLAANRSHRNLLASASADTTVKLWDLTTATCAKSYVHHTDKVCSLAWHPTSSTILLSGSWDRTVVAADMRSTEPSARWGVESDVEGIKWDPHDSNYFYISTEKGILHLHDARNMPSKLSQTRPVWTLQAHESSLTTFDINPVIPGFLATGSTDKEVKLWNIADNSPSMVVSRDLGLGKIFSVNWAPDKEVGFRLAVAGSKGVVSVWDTSTNAAVRRIFAGRVPSIKVPIEGEEAKEDRIVGVEEDQSDSDSDSDEGEDGQESGNESESDGGVKVGRRDGWESMEED